MTPTKHGLRSHAWRAFQERRCAELWREWPGAVVQVLPPLRIVPAKDPGKFGNSWQLEPRGSLKPASVVDECNLSPTKVEAK